MADKKPAAKADINHHEELKELRKELSDAHRNLASNNLANPRVIRSTRKQIARTLTAINAKRQAKEQANA